MIVYHAGSVWNEPKCGAGKRQRGASTNNIGSVVSAKEWNALPEEQRCKRCVAVIRAGKKQRADDERPAAAVPVTGETEEQEGMRMVESYGLELGRLQGGADNLSSVPGRKNEPETGAAKSTAAGEAEHKRRMTDHEGAMAVIRISDLQPMTAAQLAQFEQVRGHQPIERRHSVSNETSQPKAEKLERSSVLEVFYDLTANLAADLQSGAISYDSFPDSRDRMDTVLRWANVFEAKHGSTDWDEVDYIETVDDFYAEIVKGVRQKPAAPVATVHQITGTHGLTEWCALYQSKAYPFGLDELARELATSSAEKLTLGKDTYRGDPRFYPSNGAKVVADQPAEKPVAFAVYVRSSDEGEWTLLFEDTDQTAVSIRGGAWQDDRWNQDTGKCPAVIYVDNTDAELELYQVQDGATFPQTLPSCFGDDGEC